VKVSIVIPVLNKIEFTQQCLDRIWRNTDPAIAYEVIVVDNGSADGTAGWFAGPTCFPKPVTYLRHGSNLGFAGGNNAGARQSHGEYLLFLNNDTLVQAGWLSEMLLVAESDPTVGIVGIKQLFPYTNVIYHTGVVFAPGGVPQHLYPHLDASLPQVNQQREYQAVTGACLLISRSLFDKCGGFDEAYRNGYEDTDLCLKVRQLGARVVCCTKAFIYHYGQVSEGRTADDGENAALFARRWRDVVRVDQDEYLLRDRVGFSQSDTTAPRRPDFLPDDCIYFADDLGQASAFTWVNAQLAVALAGLGVPVRVNAHDISPTVGTETRKRLASLASPQPQTGGVQIKFSHYWPRHLNLELNGAINLEVFVTNYLFGRPHSEPWDYWIQSLRQNHRVKLPVSEFCQEVLHQIGVPADECRVLHHGYSDEVNQVEPPRRRDERFRFLTVTNSHDLDRYGTLAVIDAFEQAFSNGDTVALVVKDYGAGSGDTTLREQLKRRAHGAPIEYISAFTDKPDLIRLYKSCDAFVSAHRGEGFGMKILDAMACGLPVLTPLFGGPTAYCTPTNCFPVDFTLTPVDSGLDWQALRPTNQPLWASPSTVSLVHQMRGVYDAREQAVSVGQRARADVIEKFSWDSIARRLVGITSELRAGRPKISTTPVNAVQEPRERSPYWLGLRVSVVIPTRDRRVKLLACLDALAAQSILPQEFEVIVVDDGSVDGTKEAVEQRRFPFALRYVRQEGFGPGTARNLGIARAAGELVLFIGDDILAGPRLLEEHLLAHAGHSDAGTAILGHTDWPEGMPRNAVMDYVCGDAALQFAYTLIPRLPSLDHRFFYTSNISLKRQFLVEAAEAGVRFDPCFRHAAFEDSEFALRLIPRGLQIRYAQNARATHDHPMDLESFARREFGAGEMAVIFYRKHPAQDDQLQVRWIGDLLEPATALVRQAELLRHLEAFDFQTDALLRAIVGSFEALLAIEDEPGAPESASLPTAGLRGALHNVLRVVFDVQRTRGKVQEWFSSVEDPALIRAAQVLACVRRKIVFLDADGRFGSLQDMVTPLVSQAGDGRGRSLLKRSRQRLRRVMANPSVLSSLLAVDHFVENRLQSPSASAWLARYRRVRRQIRRSVD
jgi:GT2 family glycosyltransferase/glycosyltransferase involved in cell wall biosynthesis